jgi:hypothetical protein
MKPKPSTGFHHFTIGYVSEDEAQAQLLRNRESDLLHAGTATPSLLDTKSLLATGEVHIPLSTLQGRITHERMHAFWDVLLGSAHPLTIEQRAYARTYASREIELETITPRNHRQFYLVPALLTRRPQLATSYWIRQQARSDDNLPVSNLVDIFDKIAQGKDWAPLFQARYLKPQIPKVTLDVPSGRGSVISDITQPSTKTNPQSGGTRGSLPDGREQAVAKNKIT